MHTTTHPQPSVLTPQLLADLLDPGLTLSEVADRRTIHTAARPDLIIEALAEPITLLVAAGACAVEAGLELRGL